MSSLTQINTYSDIIIEYTDLRLPGIKLNFPAADDIPDFVADSTSFVVQRTFDIEEVINPNGTLNLTYTIDLSSIPGATLTWTSLFGGSITTESDQVYSVSAIESVADWELVRAPLITIPDDFQGSFEYTCALTYVAATGIQTLDWIVGTFVPVVNLTSEFTQISNATKFKGVGNTTLSSNFTLLGGGLEFDIADAIFASSFNMVSTVDRPFRGFTSSLAVVPIFTAIGNYQTGNIQAGLSTNSTMSVTADDPIPVIGPLESSNWTWRSNQINFPFGQNTPVIYDDDSGYNYEIQLSCDNGDFGTESSITTGTYSVSGTKASLNFGVIRDIAFYPDQGYTREFNTYETINFKLYRDGLLLINEDIGFRYAGDGGFVGSTYTFISSDTWTPTIQEHRYGEMRYLIVAGGARGGPTGGGAGGVLETSDYTDITLTSYPLIVGQGGGENPNGTESSFNGITMPGGTEGQAPNNSNPEFATVYGRGGDSGNGFQGGANDPGSNSVGNPWAWGGGAGASQNGKDGRISGYPGQAAAGDGGNGIYSFLLGITVGQGGGGAGGLYNGAETPNSYGNGGNGFGTVNSLGVQGVVKILTRTKD
jgi:hypothetical protein